MPDLKQIASTCALASGLTYLSLLVPGSVLAICGNVGTVFHCTVLAYGFPLPFVADSRSTSPTGSVARDPLSLLIGQDDVLWGSLGLSALFWLLTVVTVRLLAQRWREQYQRGKETEN